MDTKVSIRISGPEDIISAVPYLIGFKPAASLVLVGMSEKELVVTARTDLADIDTNAQMLIETLGSMQRGGADRFFAVVYIADDGRGMGDQLPEADLVRTLQAQCPNIGDGLLLLDALLVRDGRWWSYLSHGAGYCPPEGNILSDSTSPAVAELVLHGHAPLDGREEIAKLLAPAPEVLSDEEFASAMRWAAAAELDSRGADVGQLLLEYAVRSVGSGHVLTHRGLMAKFGAALEVIAFRDLFWLELDKREHDWRAFYRALARFTPEGHRAAPLSLYGWACWRKGDGASADIAARMALADQPGYNMANLVLAALRMEVPPDKMPQLVIGQA